MGRKWPFAFCIFLLIAPVISYAISKCQPVSALTNVLPFGGEYPRGEETFEQFIAVLGYYFPSAITGLIGIPVFLFSGGRKAMFLRAMLMINLIALIVWLIIIFILLINRRSELNFRPILLIAADAFWIFAVCKASLALDAKSIPKSSKQ